MTSFSLLFQLSPSFSHFRRDLERRFWTFRAPCVSYKSWFTLVTATGGIYTRNQSTDSTWKRGVDDILNVSLTQSIYLAPLHRQFSKVRFDQKTPSVRVSLSLLKNSQNSLIPRRDISIRHEAGNCNNAARLDLGNELENVFDDFWLRMEETTELCEDRGAHNGGGREEIEARWERSGVRGSCICHNLI